MSNPAIEAMAASVDSFLVISQREFHAAKEDHPEWLASFEDADPVTADREVVEQLLNTAPTEFLRGLLVGFMLFRQQMAIITGRPF